MPFEVELFLEVFMRHARRLGQHGYLNRNQLLHVFADLNIKPMSEAEQYIPRSSRGGGLAHAAEFLLIMLEVLPEGVGLNKAQIEEFVRLYRHHQVESGSIDPLEIKRIIIELKMVTAPYHDILLFRYNRPAAIQLMELMIITAERSKTAPRNIICKEKVLSTPEVRSMISKFKKLDRDGDGLLSGNEAENFVNEFNTSNPEVPMTFNFYETRINVAEYLLFKVEQKEV
ncbi:uncharacterized protein LOC126835661 [Adelges cooleyi]|uniref:uncharacterized protein LOC126835661 n=1 Tax=Adelges cooleyi TaxID=133065 RepID=UPI0021806C32|nr:uncharacterized protein LOC126835661 [Adelges cooleyi]